jgi:MFS family permease
LFVMPDSPSPSASVIATRTPGRWIAPWYGAYAILGACVSGFAPLLVPVEISRAGGSASLIGLSVAAQNLGALSAPAWGALADHAKAYRPIFFCGFFLIAVGLALFAGLHGFAPWIGASFLLGLGSGASNTVASLFIVEFTPRPEWHRRISWLQTFNAIGTALGLAAAGYVAPSLGLGLAAVLSLGGLIVGHVGLPAPRHDPPTQELPGDKVAQLVRQGGPSAAAMHQHRWRPADIGRVFGCLDSPFCVFLAGWFAFSIAASAVGAFYPILMRDSFHVSTRWSAMLISIVYAVTIPLYNLAGRLNERRGPTLVLRIGYGGRGLALLLLGALALLEPNGVAAMVVYALFQGIWPLLSVSSNDLAASLAPFGEGPAIGLFTAVGAIGSALGSIVGGAIVDVSGYGAMLLFGAVAFLLATLTTGRTAARS